MTSPATHRVDRVDLRLYAGGSGDASSTPYEPVVRWWFRDHTDDELGRVAAAGERDSRDAALELTRRPKLVETLNEEESEDTVARPPVTPKQRMEILADLGLSEGVLEELGLGQPEDYHPTAASAAVPVIPGTSPNVRSSPPSTVSPIPTP